MTQERATTADETGEGRERPQRPEGLSVAQWTAAYGAALLVMLAAIGGTDVLFTNHGFVAFTAATCVVGTGFSLFTRRVRHARWMVNWLVLAAAVGLGGVQFGGVRATYGLFGLHARGISGLDDVNLMELLACLFVWIIAFRAFTLRSVRDLTLCLIPSVSTLLLVVILRPQLGMVVFFGAVFLGGLYLFAVEHRAALAEDASFVARRRRVGSAEVEPAESSWLSVYGASVVTGAVLCIVFTSVKLPAEFARSLRIELAQRLADKIVAATGSAYASSQRSLWLYSATRPKSDTEMFRVRCERELYWRMNAYDEYLGRRWGQARSGEQSPRGGRWPLVQVSATAPAPGAGRRRAPRWTLSVPVEPEVLHESPTGLTEVRQLFFVRRPVQGGVIAAYLPVRLQGRLSRVAVNRFGALECTRPLRPGGQYVVYSLVRRPDPRQLAASGSDYPREIRETCLRVPEDVPERVWSLARMICRDADDPLAKARAIERYLGEHYEYRLTVPRPPWQSDYVDYFLFESNAGYCTHFASAMAILGRCVGLPTRMVVGYAPGEYDADDDVYVVREKDEHAWVEVYFNGIGWLPFDPTRGIRDGRLSGAAALYKRVSDWWQGVSRNHPLLRGELSRRDAVVLASLLGTVVVGVAALAIRRRRLSLYPPLPRPSPEDHRGQISHAYAVACRMLSRLGTQRGASQTPFEFAQTVAEAIPAAGPAFWALSRQYVLLTYGERPAQPAMADKARALMREVAETLRRLRP